MASVSSVGKAQNFSLKSKHKLELTEARINFCKLPETPAKAILLQNLHISGHIETINIKKATLPLIEVSFQSLPSASSFQTS